MNMNESLYSFLSLKQLKVPVYLGASREERETKQEIEINLDIMFYALPKACTTDQLKDTICYATLVDAIKIFCLKKPFRMIEHLSYELYKFIKKTLPCSCIRLEVRKKPQVHGLEESIFCLKDKDMV